MSRTERKARREMKVEEIKERLIMAMAIAYRDNLDGGEDIAQDASKKAFKEELVKIHLEYGPTEKHLVVSALKMIATGKGLTDPY